LLPKLVGINADTPTYNGLFDIFMKISWKQTHLSLIIVIIKFVLQVYLNAKELYQWSVTLAVANE